MAFVDKRLLLSSEVCTDWVIIGADVYMSVTNQSSGYYRIYKSTGGGPLVQINNAVLTGRTAYHLFKIGSTLYACYYVSNVNSCKFDKYTGGSSWVQDGYINGAQHLFQIRYYSGGVYLLFNGFESNVADSRSVIAQYNTGGIGNVAIIKDTAGTGGKVIRSFDIDPATGKFYIFAQDEGLGVGNAYIYTLLAGAEETLITFGASVEGLSLILYGGVLYLLRTNGATLTHHIFSRLSNLTTSATEVQISTTDISNGSPGVSGLRPCHSIVVNDLLVFAYAKIFSGSTAYGFFTYNTTVSVLAVLADYPYTGSGIGLDRFGLFTLDGTDNIIQGVEGKFLLLNHQAPGDVEPPPPDPEPIEDLTEELLIEVREAPCNPVTVCWLNSSGVYESYCFEDMHGVFETEIKTRIEAEYERYVEDLETDTNSTGITAKSVERSLALGADNIDADVYVGLIDLFTSPAVFLLVNADPITWQSVRVSPGSIRYSKYDHALEITLELPNLFIQRS